MTGIRHLAGGSSSLAGNDRQVTVTESGTLTVAVGCDFVYETESAVPAVFLVRPQRDPGRRVAWERWRIAPQTPFRDYRDLYGNPCRRMTLEPGTTRISFDAAVETPANPDPVGAGALQLPVEDLPDDVLLYTLPSRYCLSDVLADRAWELFGEVPPGWERAQAISDFVHEHIAFGYGTSTPTTTAVDAYENRAGVCRDFAHLGVTFCRAMNLPARYVFGYIPDIGVPPSAAPMDFCAWYEVFLGGAWWTFDPRNNERRIGRVVIARGRDALDVAMVTTYGAATLAEMRVRADEEKRGD